MLRSAEFVEFPGWGSPDFSLFSVCYIKMTKQTQEQSQLADSDIMLSARAVCVLAASTRSFTERVRFRNWVHAAPAAALTLFMMR